jgi:ATP sulfurylase
VAITTCEILWIQSLIKELVIFLVDPPPSLWCDNLGDLSVRQSCIHSRTKHVELGFHFVRERVAAKTLKVALVSSKDQVADILTKPLSLRFDSTYFAQLLLSPTCNLTRGGPLRHWTMPAPIQHARTPLDENNRIPFM